MEIADLREMVELDPEDVLMRYVLGSKLLEEGEDPTEAVGHLAYVVGHDPQHVASYLALGNAYLRQGHEEKARDVLEKGMEIASGLKHGEGLDLVPEFEDLLASI